MARLRDALEGLAILDRYDRGKGATGPERQGGYIAAEHDILYAGCHMGGHPTDLDPPDAQRLEVLGWHWDASLCCWYKFT